MTQARVCSKNTDQLKIILEFLSKIDFKEVTITWDRLEDREDIGILCLPIIELRK